MLQVIFEKVHPEAKIPTKATPGSACWDVYSIEDTEVLFGQITIVNLGFKVRIPPGYEIVVRPRSGFAFKHGITIINAPGTIDEDYRGEMKVALGCINRHYGWIDVIDSSGRYTGKIKSAFKISKGDRVAQITLKKVEEYEFVEGVVETDTVRAEGGFGSTGR